MATKNLSGHLPVVAAAVMTAMCATSAFAQTPTCTCSCFDGRPLQVCAGPSDGFICGPDICPPKPPAVPPTMSPVLPVPNDKVCKLEPVLNEATGSFEYRPVCK
jgi:hypothetical protein